MRNDKDSQSEKERLFSKLVEHVQNHKSRYLLEGGRDVLDCPYYVPMCTTMYDYLKDAFQTYERLINDATSFENIGTEFEKYKIPVSHLCKSILGCVKAYENGEWHTAYMKLRNGFLEIKEYLNIVTIEKGQLFFRARKGRFHEINQLYHLPYTKRFLAGDERFSIEGYPCLYLGYSPEVCALELEEIIDKLGQLTIAQYKLLDSEFIDGIIDLTYRRTDNVEEENKKVVLWPLILSCYLITCCCPRNDFKESDDKRYKEEYLIPQLLTAILRSRKEYHGIRYYSVRDRDLDPVGTGSRDFRNLILFTEHKHDMKQEYDGPLMAKFSISFL